MGTNCAVVLVDIFVNYTNLVEFNLGADSSFTGIFFKNDSEMTEQDIENEVQKRVQFKLDAFFTGMENRIKHNEASAFSLVLAGNYRDGARAENYKDAWSHVKAAFIKEMNMSLLKPFRVYGLG